MRNNDYTAVFAKEIEYRGYLIKRTPPWQFWRVFDKETNNIVHEIGSHYTQLDLAKGQIDRLLNAKSENETEDN